MNLAQKSRDLLKSSILFFWNVIFEQLDELLYNLIIYKEFFSSLRRSEIMKLIPKLESILVEFKKSKEKKIITAVKDNK